MADDRTLQQALHNASLAGGGAVAGLIRLSRELEAAGVIDGAAVDRVRDAVVSDISDAPAEGAATISQTIRRAFDASKP